jgi:hypothetical protein
MKRAFRVSAQIGDGSILDNIIAAHSVFGAVEFIKVEAIKNGWFLVGLLVEPFTDEDVIDGHVREIKAS